jgi:hypothetical protein
MLINIATRKDGVDQDRAGLNSEQDSQASDSDLSFIASIQQVI